MTEGIQSNVRIYITFTQRIFYLQIAYIVIIIIVCFVIGYVSRG